MARIKIEDLPVGKALTPEQEEQLFGAGFRPFQPTFEPLEAREMMDAGIGHALLAPMPTSTGGDAPHAGHVRMLAGNAGKLGSITGPTAPSTLGQQAGSPQASQPLQDTWRFEYFSFDPDRLANYVRDTINRENVKGGNNFWEISSVEQYRYWSMKDTQGFNHFKVDLRVNFKDGGSTVLHLGFWQASYNYDDVPKSHDYWKSDGTTNMDRCWTFQAAVAYTISWFDPPDASLGEPVGPKRNPVFQAKDGVAQVRQQLVRQADEAGLSLSTGELQQAANACRRSAGLNTAAETHAWLGQQGMSAADFEGLLEANLLAGKLRQQTSGADGKI
jgi:hypothetical protein